MNSVLDAHALLAYLEREPGYKQVLDELNKSAQRQENLSMSTVNWGEVYYIICREHGKEKADHIAEVIETLPVKLIPVDVGLAKEAARIKASKRMSYADCFAAALAKTQKACLLTGDKDFKEVEGEIKILWLKRNPRE